MKTNYEPLTKSNKTNVNQTNRKKRTKQPIQFVVEDLKTGGEATS